MKTKIGVLFIVLSSLLLQGCDVSDDTYYLNTEHSEVKTSGNKDISTSTSVDQPNANDQEAYFYSDKEVTSATSSTSNTSQESPANINSPSPQPDISKDSPSQMPLSDNNSQGVVGDNTQIGMMDKVLLEFVLANGKEIFDLNTYNIATQYSMESSKNSSGSSWEAVDKKSKGLIAVVKTFKFYTDNNNQADFVYCREYVQKLEMNGKGVSSIGVGCRDKNAPVWSINYPLTEKLNKVVNETSGSEAK